jgi:uncharacterized membrane protein
VSNHLVVVDRERHAGQEFTARWTEDAFATFRLKRSAMSCAENITPIFRQELVVDPIHGHGDVAAAVHVSEQLAFIIDHEALSLSAVDQQDKLLGLTGRNFSDARNDSFSIGHESLHKRNNTFCSICMNGDASSNSKSKVQSPKSKVEADSYRNLGPWTFSQVLLLVFSLFCLAGSVYAQDDVPVPPLEEGALFIFHPIAVHFAVALTSFGCVLDWLGSLRAQFVWQQAGKICFFAGVVALGLAALSGWVEHELPRPPSAFDTHAQSLLFYHEYGGYALAGFFLVLAIFRVGINERLPLFFVALSAVGLIGLLVQGYLGGELVYRYGAGVRAVQILSTQVPQVEQKKAPEGASEAKDK